MRQVSQAPAASRDATPQSSPDAPGESRDGFVYAMYAATAVLLLARIPVLARRFFDPDELQHTHDAWYTFKGLLPYRDFFEHHTPWYYYTLRPFFRWFAVDTSFDSARHFLIFARSLSLVLAAAAVALLVVVGRLMGNRRVGALAGLLLAGLPICIQKTVEIRPDVLALPFCVGSMALLLSALGGAWTSRKLWRFAGAGFCLGAAIMCTQKILFVLPGVFLGLGIWFLFSKAPVKPRPRVLAVAALILGLAIPMVLTWAGFAAHHAGRQLIENNFLLNAKWKVVVHEQLFKTLETTWPALILCLLGATVTVYRHVRGKDPLYGEIVLLTTLFGLIAGIFVMPVAHRQYYLILLPITCVFAAKGLLFLVGLARRQRLVMGVCLLALNVMPVIDLCDGYTSPNDEQMNRLRLVLERTKPTDLVMDGWNGTGVFRPHAFHYHFIHEELVPMIPTTTASAFVDSLEKGTVHPQLITLDENLILTFGSRFVRFVQKNYETNDGLLYFAKQPAR